MKINFWKLMLHLLKNENGNISLAGEPAGAVSGPNVGGDPVVSGEPAAVGEPIDNGTPVEEVTPISALDPDPQPAEVSFPEGLEAEVKEDPSLKVFIQDGKFNYANLLKSYVHAQKKMGEKGIKVPDQYATKEDWDQFYNNIRPAELDKYEVKNNLPEGMQPDEETFAAFKTLAHENGLTTQQAQTVLDWYNNRAGEVQTQQNTRLNESYKKDVENLKADWGDSFQNELNLAQRAVREFAGEDVINYLKESGLDGNVHLVRLFNKIGHGLMEDKFTQESHGTFGVTKEEAERKMAAIYGDTKHPYFDDKHPSHKHAVEEMLKLNEAVLRS